MRFNVSREDAEFPASHEPKSVPDRDSTSKRTRAAAGEKKIRACWWRISGPACLIFFQLILATLNTTRWLEMHPQTPNYMAENSKASDIEDYSVIPPPSSQFLHSLISHLKTRTLWIVAECNLGVKIVHEHASYLATLLEVSFLVFSQA